MSEEPLARLLAVRKHQRGGQRSPHKPLLMLLALGQYAASGSSRLDWATAAPRLAALLAEFGPPSAGRSLTQAAAYPFTRLRSDGVWILSRDVPMDLVTPLATQGVVGSFVPEVEAALRRPDVVHATARAIVEAEFPASLADDVLLAVGLDPEAPAATTAAPGRRRSAGWPGLVIAAWDRQCAFCGFDGQLGAGSVALEAAHVRWFNFDGPDDLDNGLALCSLHHKLFDRGALGLSVDHRIQVSADFTARTEAGRRVYDLADKPLRPRPGTPLPAEGHRLWHQTQVFKGHLLRA